MGNIVFVDPKELPVDMAGADVSWDLAPNGVDIESFEAALAPFAEKRIGAPQRPAPGSVLLRVMGDLYANRRCLVKPTRNPDNTADPTYAVLPRRDDGGKMAFVSEWYAWVTEVNDIVIVNGAAQMVPLGHHVGFSDSAPESEHDRVRDSFANEILKLGTTEQSTWLVNLVKGVFCGTSMPGGHGHYFIGPYEVAIWRTLKPVVERYGLRLYETPALRSDQLANTVLAGLRQQIDREKDELEEDLKKFVTEKSSKKNTQERVLAARQKRCEEVIDRIVQYEQLFDRRLDELKDSVKKLRHSFNESNILT